MLREGPNFMTYPSPGECKRIQKRMNDEHEFEEAGYEITEVEDDGTSLEDGVNDTGDPLDDEGSRGFDPKGQYSKKELEEWADELLRDDANRELCKRCKEDGEVTPYGHETGEVEWQIQRNKDGEPLFDEQGQTLYVGFPELCCEKGHRWYKGEGPRRDIRGPNPILFENHLYSRKRREIHVTDGIPDPAFTMDRWGKRPTQGIYNRAHPQGRKINTPEQRARNGASWYR